MNQNDYSLKCQDRGMHAGCRGGRKGSFVLVLEGGEGLGMKGSLNWVLKNERSCTKTEGVGEDVPDKSQQEQRPEVGKFVTCSGN